MWSALLVRFDDDELAAVHCAIERDHLKVVRLLLASTADPATLDPLLNTIPFMRGNAFSFRVPHCVSFALACGSRLEAPCCAIDTIQKAFTKPRPTEPKKKDKPRRVKFVCEWRYAHFPFCQKLGTRGVCEACVSVDSDFLVERHNDANCSTTPTKANRFWPLLWLWLYPWKSQVRVLFFFF